MRMRTTKTGIFGFVILAALGFTMPLPAKAQSGDGNVTIVHPDDNGFEALMRAGDPALDDEKTRLGRLMTVVFSGSATLTDRRAAVNSPEFRDTLGQMRTALDYSLLAPTFNSAADLWAFGGPLRRLARFLLCETDVLFADGKTLNAVDEFAEGLQMADRAKRWGIAGVGTGQTVEAVILRHFVQHLEQLSARDCDRLFSLLRQELIAPDPAIEGFRSQKDLAHLEVENVIAIMDLPTGAVGPDGQPAYDIFQSLTPAERQTIISLRTGNPQSLSSLRTAATERLSTFYDRVAGEFAAYPNQETTLPAADTVGSQNDMITRLIYSGSNLGPNGQGTSIFLIEHAVSSRARLHLLAVHTAILRWRWENNVVPANLAEMRLGPLALDPFTGQPLVYKRIDNTRFTLASAGPPARDDNGQILPGAKRDPLTLASFGP